MAMGPAPNENHRHRRPDPFEEHKQSVSADAKPVSAPKLPNATRYSKAVRDWYATWAKSPQAATFLATDWQRLHMLAPVVEAYWAAKPGSQQALKMLAEIRQSESALGATHLDRLRGRLKVERPGAGGATKAPVKPEAAPAEGVASLADRRKRLTDAG